MKTTIVKLYPARNNLLTIDCAAVEVTLHCQCRRRCVSMRLVQLTCQSTVLMNWLKEVLDIMVLKARGIKDLRVTVNSNKVRVAWYCSKPGSGSALAHAGQLLSCSLLGWTWIMQTCWHIASLSRPACRHSAFVGYHSVQQAVPQTVHFCSSGLLVLPCHARSS